MILILKLVSKINKKKYQKNKNKRINSKFSLNRSNSLFLIIKIKPTTDVRNKFKFINKFPPIAQRGKDKISK